MTEDVYKTLAEPAEGLFRDRNSRFLSFGYPVESVEQVNERLLVLRKKYHDAKHHCYAFVLGHNKETSRMNDDGEPSGTAGRPIFNQIQAYDLTNTLVVVVRYFGSTLLGTGGLINAYRSATTSMFDKAGVVTKYVLISQQLKFRYEQLGMVMKILKDESLAPIHPVYDSDCIIEIQVRKGLKDKLTAKLNAVPDMHIETLLSKD